MNAIKYLSRSAGLAVLSLAVAAGLFAQDSEPADPAEITVGERLFLETRFAQAFYATLLQGKMVNDAMEEGDSVVETVQTIGEPLPGPFAGSSINCRSCHFVDEHLGIEGGGMRTYADFARRSPVPAREDGAVAAPRNAPALVNASLDRPGGVSLHFDGEFASMEDLVRGTLSGRNFGWLPGEGSQAAAHAARVIREDDGSGDLAAEFESIPYGVLLTGSDPSIPAELVLPQQYRVDVDVASDAEIFDAVAALVAAYASDLEFSRDDDGDFNLSPYDAFLEANSLPRHPAAAETPLDYSRRLLGAVLALESRGELEFVYSNPALGAGGFQFHDDGFRFSHRELQGFKAFFSEAAGGVPTPVQAAAGGRGACIQCHAAPSFTDFRFHNTGVAADEYDSIHGAGAFELLEIPDLETRNADLDAYLPANDSRPAAAEPFRRIPSLEQPGWTDLGLWNIFANPDAPAPQPKIWRILCEPELLKSDPRLAKASPEQLDRVMSAMAQGDREFDPCTEAQLLEKSIAAFKTPGLRDLGHSGPYMHNGLFDTIEETVAFYLDAAKAARAGELRNAPAELRNVAVSERDFALLTAFVKSLSEDYE